MFFVINNGNNVRGFQWKITNYDSLYHEKWFDWFFKINDNFSILIYEGSSINIDYWFVGHKHILICSYAFPNRGTRNRNRDWGNLIKCCFALFQNPSCIFENHRLVSSWLLIVFGHHVGSMDYTKYCWNEMIYLWGPEIHFFYRFVIHWTT